MVMDHGVNWDDLKTDHLDYLEISQDHEKPHGTEQRLDTLVLDSFAQIRQAVASSVWFDLDFAAPETALGQRSATSIAPALIAAVKAILRHDPAVPRIDIRIRRIGHDAILMIAGKPVPARAPTRHDSCNSSALVRIAIAANLGLSFRNVYGRNVIALSVPAFRPSFGTNAALPGIAHERAERVIV